MRCRCDPFIVQTGYPPGEQYVLHMFYVQHPVAAASIFPKLHFLNCCCMMKQTQKQQAGSGGLWGPCTWHGELLISESHIPLKRKVWWCYWGDNWFQFSAKQKPHLHIRACPYTQWRCHARAHSWGRTRVKGKQWNPTPLSRHAPTATQHGTQTEKDSGVFVSSWMKVCECWVLLHRLIVTSVDSLHLHRLSLHFFIPHVGQRKYNWRDISRTTA